LKHLAKKEKKGAIRELRKDAKFIARVRLNEQLARDQERSFVVL
jgi:nucleolar protein 14